MVRVRGRVAHGRAVRRRARSDRTLHQLSQVDDEGILGLVDKLVTLATLQPPARRAAAIAGLASAFAAVTERPLIDPLADVDEPLDLEESAATAALAAAEASEVRETLLAQSVNAEEAARFTARTRQALERMRRAGRALALRDGSQ